MDNQNITIKLIQFTKAISECMDENLRLQSQLKKEREDAKMKLIEYGTHKKDCQIVSAGFLIAEEKRVCTCGLNNLKP